MFIVVLRSMGVKKKKDVWAAWGYNASMAQCDHSTGTEDTAACMHVCVAYIWRFLPIFEVAKLALASDALNP